MVKDPPASQETSSREFLEQAYTLESLEDAMTFYSQWAGDYDAQMEDGLGYVAPRTIAEKLAKVMPDRNGRVLDVGCGTGLTSRYLHDMGVTLLDGIDINAAMLEEAAKRDLFATLREADITVPLDIADDTYDGVICSGTFTLGHVGAESLDELVRVLKPNGHLACTVHRDVFEPKGFRSAFERLERDGDLERVERSEGPFFKGKAHDAFYCVYRKV